MVNGREQYCGQIAVEEAAETDEGINMWKRQITDAYGNAYPNGIFLQISILKKTEVTFLQYMAFWGSNDEKLN